MSRPSATEYSSFYQTYVNYTSGKDYSILVQQYHDRIGLYHDLDHKDKKRQALYKARHAKDINKLYSPGWFSWNFLWT